MPTNEIEMEFALSGCECQFWARDSQRLHTPHHPTCKHYSAERYAASLLLRLIEGIEAWSNDEDGVHSDCWEAYTEACHAIGQPRRYTTKETV